MTQLHLETGKKKNRAIKTLFTYYKNGSSFEYKAASLYSATIHWDSNEFSIGFTDLKTGDVLAIEKMDSEETSPLKSIQSLTAIPKISSKLQSASNRVLYSTSSKFTLVPSLFFEKSKIQELTKGVLQISPQETFHSQFIPEIDSHIIFVVPVGILKSLKASIGHTEVAHHFASLISTYSLYYTEKGRSTVFLQYHKNAFSLALFTGKNLIHFNVFEVKSFEDILYFTYYTLEQFDFSPSESRIHFGGNYSDSDKVLMGLQKYTKSIYHLKPKCCSNLDTAKADALINTIFDIQCG